MTSQSFEQTLKDTQAQNRDGLRSSLWPNYKQDWFKYTSVADIKGVIQDSQLTHPEANLSSLKSQGVKAYHLSEVLKMTESKLRDDCIEMLRDLPARLKEDVFVKGTLSSLYSNMSASIVIDFDETLSSEITLDLDAILTDRAGSAAWNDPLIFVSLKKGVHAKMYLKRGPTQTDSLRVALSLWNLAENSRLELVCLDDLGDAVRCMDRNHKRLSKNAIMREYRVQSGGKKSQTATVVSLSGEGAEYKLLTATATAQMQHCDQVVWIAHVAPHTRSEMESWSVASDQSKTVFNGNIEILPKAIKSEAHQKNRNMLLTQQAEIHTAPKLEIACDDVKCSHGASITTINDDQLYYFQTRGVSREEASQLIVSGFVEPVLECVADELHRDTMRAAFLTQILPQTLAAAHAGEKGRPNEFKDGSKH